MSIFPTAPMQSLGTGSDVALAIKKFGGLVLMSFDQVSAFWPNIAKQTITEGNSFQFPAIGRMGTIDHTPGEDLPGGGEPLSEERTIPVDDKEVVGHAWVTKVQKNISHFDVLNPYAMEAAKGIARTIDSRTARMICLGARQAARGGGAFSSGNLVRQNYADVTTGFSADSTGADRLYDSLLQIGQGFKDRNVDGEYVAYLTPYMYRVALNSTKLTSRDYAEVNKDAMAKGKIYYLAGFRLVESNVFSTGFNMTTGPSAYRGDFRYTAVVCTGHNEAAGAVTFGDIDPFGPTWYDHKRSWLLGAAWFGGIKWLRPEACGEIYCSTTAYS